MSERERKVEASMPVQSRVDLRTLAELLVYWEKQGIEVSTMSRLVSWSLDALRMILDKNGAIEFRVESLQRAYEVLEGKGMLQRSMKKKMEAKFMKSRAMENLRLEGWNAREAGGKFYEELHPKNEVKPFMGSARVSDEEYEKVVGMRREKVRELTNQGISDEEMERQKNNGIEAARRLGRLAETVPKVDREMTEEQRNQFKVDEHQRYVEEVKENNVKEAKRLAERGNGKYGKVRPQGGGNILIDIDRNLRKMKEADEKLKDM